MELSIPHAMLHKRQPVGYQHLLRRLSRSRAHSSLDSVVILVLHSELQLQELLWQQHRD